MLGVPPHWRHPQVPLFAQTSMPKYDLFSEPLPWIVTFQEMTIDTIPTKMVENWWRYELVSW